MAQKEQPRIEPLGECTKRESQGLISRWIFVAHRTGKFPGIKETRDARQRFWLAKPAAGAAATGPTQQSPQGALVQVAVELAT